MRSLYLALVPVFTIAVWPQDHLMGHIATHDTGWVALMKNMETMHAAMAAVEPSGNEDGDFVNLMLPHHQAAVDMARTELLYGSDPQMRRLAQEIITDQESEIRLMQLWIDRQRVHAKKYESAYPAPARGRRNRMRIYRSAGFRLLYLGAALTLVDCAFAQQAPWGRPNIPVSTHDRVYAADQTSNTVSVIDPSNNKLLGVIRLGNPVPGALSPLYKGQLLVHGLGYSPDSRTLAVVSVASNAVTFIDVATNKVKGTIYVGRSPHEAFFTRDGRELWVTVRGEDYISVIDPNQLKEIRRIQLANGPGMTMFGTDGKYAFVCSSFTPELAVVETASHQIVKRISQASPFCPNIAVSRKMTKSGLR
jgi:YVTN family beta-propeller protein